MSLIDAIKTIYYTSDAKKKVECIEQIAHSVKLTEGKNFYISFGKGKVQLNHRVIEIISEMTLEKGLIVTESDDHDFNVEATSNFVYTKRKK